MEGTHRGRRRQCPFLRLPLPCLLVSSIERIGLDRVVQHTVSCTRSGIEVVRHLSKLACSPDDGFHFRASRNIGIYSDNADTSLAIEPDYVGPDFTRTTAFDLALSHRVETRVLTHLSKGAFSTGVGEEVDLAPANSVGKTVGSFWLNLFFVGYRVVVREDLGWFFVRASERVVYGRVECGVHSREWRTRARIVL